jgi:hypothetical protein
MNDERLFTADEIAAAIKAAGTAISKDNGLQPHTKGNMQNILVLFEIKLQRKAPISTAGILNYLEESLGRIETEPFDHANEESQTAHAKNVRNVQRCCNELAEVLEIKAQWVEAQRNRGAAELVR